MRSTLFFRNTLTTLAVMALITVLGHCGSGPMNSLSPSPSPKPPSSKSLTAYESCDVLLNDFKSVATTAAKEVFDSYYTCPEDINYPIAEATSSAGDTASATAAPLQETGVDEADMSKSDGRFLYVAHLNTLSIYQLIPSSAFAQIATYTVQGQISGLYLDGSQLVILSRLYSNNRDYASQTAMVVLDVRAPSAPQVVSSSRFDGYLAESRLIDHTLHMALSEFYRYPIVHPTIDYSLQRQAICEKNSAAYASLTAAVETARKATLDAIAATTLADWVPTYQVKETWHSIPCENFLKTANNTVDQFINFVSVRTDTEIPSPQISVLRGRANSVYASRNAFYIAEVIAHDGTDSTPESAVHRFDIRPEIAGDALHLYTATAEVNGFIKDRFSMGENGSMFAAFTTTFPDAVIQTFAPDNDTLPTVRTRANNLYTFKIDDMSPLGKLENLAPGERLYAARFIGDQAYLVTAEQIDPFFAISLASPENPTLLGEVKLPGFSTYLYGLDPTHILALGLDQGVQLSLFNVSPIDPPTLNTQAKASDNYGYSSALYDAHAFTFDPTTQELLLPIENIYSSTYSFNYSLDLYHVSPEQGFERTLTIPTTAMPYRSAFIEADGESLIYIIDYDQTIYLADRATGRILKQTNAPLPAAYMPD